MEQFRSALNKDNLMSAATISLVQGQTLKIGEYEVKAGQMIRLGFGENESQEGALGRIYVALKDTTGTPVDLDGKLRFSVHSPQGRPLRVLAEYRTETLRSDANNRTLQVPFPVNGMPFISEDKKLVLEFISDTNATLSKANSKILFDITDAIV